MQKMLKSSSSLLLVLPPLPHKAVKVLNKKPCHHQRRRNTGVGVHPAAEESRGGPGGCGGGAPVHLPDAGRVPAATHRGAPRRPAREVRVVLEGVF